MSNNQNKNSNLYQAFMKCYNDSKNTPNFPPMLSGWIETNNIYIQNILKNFNSINGDLIKGNLSATVFNDYYKWSMLPVIRCIETSPLFCENPVHVTFSVNIRTPEYREMLSNNLELRQTLLNNLNKLKDRKFNKDLFKTIINFRNLKIDEETIEIICGSDENPRSLIDEVIEQKYSPTPENKDKVVVSFYNAANLKLNSDRYYIEATGPWHKVTWLETTLMQCVYKTLLDQRLKNERKSYATWMLESMIRCAKSVRSVLDLDNDMNRSDIQGALFTGRRTGGFAFMLMQNLFIKDNYKKCLGTSSVDAWYKLSEITNNIIRENPNIAPPINQILPPVGTHAHELSMVISTLFSDIDKGYPLTQILGHYLYYYNSNVPQIPMLPDTLGTEAFMKIGSIIEVLTKANNKNKKPFFEIINSARQDSGSLGGFIEILKKYSLKPGKSNGNNRNNTNTATNYYPFLYNIMASEIENVKDLKCAFGCNEVLNQENNDKCKCVKNDDTKKYPYYYNKFGAGGFFGDSVSAWNSTKSNISMAVKAARVYVNYKLTKKYPVKTGNSSNYAKLEINGTLNKNMFNDLKATAINIKNSAYDKSFIKESAQNDFDNTIKKLLQPNILLYGLSANPPTGIIGHRGICKYFVDTGIFTEIWLLPVYKHAFDSKSDLLDYESRFELAKLNFEDLSNTQCKVSVKNVEKELKKFNPRSYTINLLEYLRNTYKDSKFSFLLGTDTFNDILLGKWSKGNVILETTDLYVVTRAGEPELNIKNRTKFMQPVKNSSGMENKGIFKSNLDKLQEIIATHKKPHQISGLTDISSTKIRKALNEYLTSKDEESLKFLEDNLYEPVLNYLLNNPETKKYYRKLKLIKEKDLQENFDTLQEIVKKSPKKIKQELAAQFLDKINTNKNYVKNYRKNSIKGLVKKMLE
jgi:nicotinate (nicotinamide) nucleotide adenylyltransferase